VPKNRKVSVEALWHLPCRSSDRRSITCSYNVQAGGCDGRSTEGNSGGSRRLEVWRRLYLNNFDFLDSVLATWLCPLLSAADIHLFTSWRPVLRRLPRLASPVSERSDTTALGLSADCQHRAPQQKLDPPASVHGGSTLHVSAFSFL